MARTEHPVTEDPNTLRVCSSGARCVHKNEGEMTHPLPRTLEFFPADSWMPDGMSPRCRKCASVASMASRKKKKARERGEVV